MPCSRLSGHTRRHPAIQAYGHGIKLVSPLSTVDNTRDYARVSHSRQWSNYNLTAGTVHCLQEECARVLLFRGANKTLRNRSIEDAFQTANTAGHTNLADVIRRFTANEVGLYSLCVWRVRLEKRRFFEKKCYVFSFLTFLKVFEVFNVLKGFWNVLVYKEDRTQNYGPIRTSYTPFSLSHRFLYNKTHKVRLKYEIKYDLYKNCTINKKTAKI